MQRAAFRTSATAYRRPNGMEPLVHIKGREQFEGESSATKKASKKAAGRTSEETESSESAKSEDGLASSTGLKISFEYTVYRRSQPAGSK